ncbi:NAD(P)H-dependent oxidoreductase [Nocardioides panacisoli]|uniref:NADPH-dependent FMN reductase n=1 Tax=Nocardioides panacisoli TaxID=627624 RepID=UPI001C6368B2|nr:NAD(P)H-dependent oxidoreductase [Nocardioides panacisoli]QYJ04495.1 NAD(P)H-dependent oxidoreductase [Nocardioides panacisoli]
MTATTRIAVLVGSLRADSVNRQLAEALRDDAPEGVVLDIVDGLENVPFYNEDLDADTAPEAATLLRNRVDEADRVLVVTPEYNGTMPAVLNNALDWLSRPYGDGAVQGTPLAVIGTTPTPYGGKWAHEHTLHSAKIAGAVIVEDVTVSQPGVEVDVLADTEVHRTLRAAVQQLVDFDPDAAAA